MSAASSFRVDNDGVMRPVYNAERATDADVDPGGQGAVEEQPAYGQQGEHEDARQVVAALIRDAVDEAVQPLLERIEELQTQVSAVASSQSDDTDGDSDPTADGGSSADPDAGDKVVPYEKQRKAALEDQVAERNEGRDTADQVVVAGSGTVKDLAAALTADDAAQAAKSQD